MLTAHSLCSQCINGTGKHHRCDIHGRGPNSRCSTLRWHKCKRFVKAKVVVQVEEVSQLIPTQTLRKHCSNCKKLILVAAISPNDNHDFLTGIWLRSMDQDFNYHNRGYLCEQCAFDLCDKGIVSLGFCGGVIGDLDNCEAMLEKPLPSWEVSQKQMAVPDSECGEKREDRKKMCECVEE